MFLGNRFGNSIPPSTIRGNEPGEDGTRDG